MQLKGNSYVFVFALAVCLACSILLSLVSEGLRPKKELNVVLDIKKNILKAVQLRDPLDIKATPKEILKVYESKITEVVVDSRGAIVEDKTIDQLTEDDTGLYPLYIYKEGSRVIAYCFPIIGKGLWSTLYGYFALEPDAETVRGITFYKHGETPGLGAEIEKDWFQQNFVGKKIWSERERLLKPIAVVKGKVLDKFKGEDAQYYVDGISGATMTAKGVTEMLDKWLNVYEPFFKNIRMKYNRGR